MPSTAGAIRSRANCRVRTADRAGDRSVWRANHIGHACYLAESYYSRVIVFSDCSSIKTGASYLDHQFSGTVQSPCRNCALEYHPSAPFISMRRSCSFFAVMPGSVSRHCCIVGHVCSNESFPAAPSVAGRSTGSAYTLTGKGTR